MANVHEWIDAVGRCIQALAVSVIAGFIFIGTCGWLLHSFNNIERAYERYRMVLGKTLLIGLELLVAADIIQTVSTPLTMINVVLLGGIVLVRTFLGWTLTVEIEGRWPWQREKETAVRPLAAVQTRGA
jgi:uncharacterized membrane protein